MPVRVVRPSASAVLGAALAAPREGGPTGAPLDLEGELRRAAVAVAPDAFDMDTLEALASIACEALGDSTDAEEQRTALQPAVEPVLEEAGLSEELRAAVLTALLSAAGSGTASLPAVAEAFPASLRRPPPHKAENEGKEKRYRRRWEVESARAAEYLEERAVQVAAERAEEEVRERELMDFYRAPGALEAPSSQPAPVGPTFPAKTADEDSSSDDSEEDDEQTIRDREATKRRLRELGEPATLFGEGDDGRTARLNRCELIRDQDVLATGSTNVLQLINRRAKLGVNVDCDEDDFEQPAVPQKQAPTLSARAAADEEALSVLSSLKGLWEDEADPSTSGQIVTTKEAAKVASGDQDAEDDFENQMDDAAKVVATWLRVTLREWEVSLTERAKEEHANRAFVEERGKFRQSKQYLRPLRRALRDRSINPAIINSLQHVATCCEQREYKEAKEAYMRLAIGNQAWPMGVTMATFHDRPNRHNIGEGAVAHILNDETTRKYIQTVKRLLTFAELRWPIDPSLAA
mmetsp:Transcript_64352/g.112114  ORF Transcript_64352/g.112114 Transcript_64352/m.112114 type:complete len:522 (-) Transcript_64352:47-1612(-)